MLFNITYRDRDSKNGARKVLQLEAASKADLWPILKERGISAISISETTEKLRKSGAQKNEKSGALQKVVLLIAASIIVGGGALWLLSNRKAEVAPKVVKEKPKAIAQVSPKVAKQKAKAPKVEEKVKEETDPAKRRVETLSFFTNSMGMIVERYKTADGKTHKLIRPSKPPLFKHMTDDLISMAMCTSGGGQMPPLPLSGNLDKEFLESLKEPIVINDDDPEEIKERKRIVAETRKEIDALMKQGISFRSILADHERVFNENAAIRAEAKAELKKICEEGDAEGVQKYLDTMNAAFQEMGIQELEMPKTREERRAEMEARRAAREASKQKGNK